MPPASLTAVPLSSEVFHLSSFLFAWSSRAFKASPIPFRIAAALKRFLKLVHSPFQLITVVFPMKGKLPSHLLPACSHSQLPCRPSWNHPQLPSRGSRIWIGDMRLFFQLPTTTRVTSSVVVKQLVLFTMLQSFLRDHKFHLLGHNWAEDFSSSDLTRSP